MAELFGTFAAGLRLAVFFGVTGAIFALGFALICKWLEWAPINITVVNNNHPVTVRDAALPSQHETGGGK